MTTDLAFLPTPEQTQLLRACLLDDGRAVAAFRVWRRSVHLDSLDPASARLLPLLAARLTSLGIDDSELGRYRGVQRLAWAQNQMLFRAVRDVLDDFAGVGITPLLLKGVALSAAVYPHNSMRAMGDLDLLVPPQRAGQAIDRLLDAGWVPLAKVPRRPMDFVVQHALSLAHPQAGDRVEIDLHWRLFTWHGSEAGEPALWTGAVPVPMLGAHAIRPSDANLLMHVCGHGAAWNPLPPIRWVADATMILRRGQVDWAQLVEQSERFGLVTPVRHVLDYLVREFDASVPPEVIRALGAARARPIDALRFAFDQVPWDRRTLWPTARLHLDRARRMTGGGPAAMVRYAHRMRDGRSAGDTARWLWSRAFPAADG